VCLSLQNDPPHIRARDKIVFTLGVVNVLVLAVCVGGFPEALPWYFSVKLPILMGLRFRMYLQQKWGYFMLDFCYFANLLLFVYLWAFAASTASLFPVIFAVSNGPLAWAVVLFRNSLVFHSMDKITSCFIHISPALVTFALRWYAAAGASPYTSPRPALQRWAPGVCLAPLDDAADVASCNSLAFFLGWPLVFYVAHQVVYVVCIRLICPLPKDDHFLTSYRWLTQSGSLKKLRGMKYGWLVYGFANLVISAAMMAPAILLYQWFWLHATFLAAIVLRATWNGACFYVEVFARSYEGWERRRRETEARRASELTPRPAAPPAEEGSASRA
jgi:hypothetical protein